MNRFATVVKLTLLIFANSIVLFAQPDSIYQLPAGTHIRLKLDAEINSKSASVNDTFLAIVSKPVLVRDTIVLPAGVVVEGRVSSVLQAASGGQNGNLVLAFETLNISSDKRRIDGVMTAPVFANASQTFSILSILGALAAGAAVGGVAGSSRGALIGGGVGAGIGASIALLRKGKDAKIRKGEEVEIELKKEVVLPVLDY
ncbi:MAG: hypothetical protein ABIO36_03645 [Pyrinomonadaceae bacterium]